MEKVNFETATKKETCDRHGEFDSHKFFKVWTKCPVCACELEAERAARDEAQKAEDKRKALEKRLGATCIPERYHDRTLSSYQANSEAQKRVQAFCIEYASNFRQSLKSGKSLLFCGRPGTGKTHLAAGIGLEVMNKGNTVLFTTVMRLIRRVKDSWSQSSAESESQAIAVFTGADLLILDEVGVQFGSEFEKNLMFDVINERYEKRKPTIFISNLAVEDVKNYLGERVFDRLKEDGGEYFAFDWESHRGRV